MPISKSAKKFMRSSDKRRIRNLAVKKNMRVFTKKAYEWIKKGDLKKAKEFSVKAVQAIDKASQKKVIKKNKANRKKSQLSRDLNKIKKGS